MESCSGKPKENYLDKQKGVLMGKPTEIQSGSLRVQPSETRMELSRVKLMALAWWA